MRLQQVANLLSERRRFRHKTGSSMTKRLPNRLILFYSD